MKSGQMVAWGVVLILAGALLILVQGNVLPWHDGMLWPVVMLAAALFFHLKYFAGGRKSPDLLVPGGILAVYGLLLLALLWLDAGWRGRLAGVWVLGPALGLAELALAGKKQKSLWVVAGVLAVVGALMLLQANLHVNAKILPGTALVALGLFLVIRQAVRSRKES